MYGMLLATLLTADNAVLGADLFEEIQELKRSIREVRQEQTQARVDELQQTIAGLRERLLEEKLNELRRNIQDLRNEGTGYPRAPWPVPLMPRSLPSSQRALISLQVPPSAAISVNDREISVPSVNPSFVSPVLEPGRDYFYDFKVTLVQDGKTVVRIKRVTVRPGAMVRLNYEDMEVR